MKIIFDRRELDLTAHLPLRVGDWKALAEGGHTVERLRSGDLSSMSALAHRILNKSDPSITPQQVDQMSLSELDKFVAAVVRTEGEVDRPFLTVCTSSPAPTAGDQTS